MPRSVRLLVPLAVLLICSAPATAQRSTTDSGARFARIVIIQPKPGQESAFEAGYRRHLAWHAAHRDPWTWRAWTFTLGDRLDLFMDGTFGHRLSDFDSPVDPAGDRADNGVNVEPYADFIAHGVFERLTPAQALPDSSPWLSLTTCWLYPGQERAFEDLIVRRSAGSVPGASAWYRLRLGGETPQYILFQGAPSFSEAAGIEEFFTGNTAVALAGVVRKTRRELLRYRRDMAYHP